MSHRRLLPAVAAFATLQAATAAQADNKFVVSKFPCGDHECLTIQSRADTLIVKDIVVNRGNCILLLMTTGAEFNPRSSPFPMGFGQSVQFFTGTPKPGGGEVLFCGVIEVRISTSLGSSVFSW